MVAMCFFTTLIVTINIVAKSDSNLLPPGFDVSTLTPEQVHDREYGSKLVLVVEQSQIMTTWCEKLCLLFLYQRLVTVGSKERLAIKVLFYYVGISFVVMEVLYFGVWCRPFTMYWAVPSTKQCTAATNHLILNAVFNLSSDILILAVALPMFIKTRLPLRKKIAIVGIFSLGTFVIICAILNKVRKNRYRGPAAFVGCHELDLMCHFAKCFSMHHILDRKPVPFQEMAGLQRRFVGRQSEVCGTMSMKFAGTKSFKTFYTRILLTVI